MKVYNLKGVLEGQNLLDPDGKLNQAGLDAVRIMLQEYLPLDVEGNLSPDVAKLLPLLMNRIRISSRIRESE